MLCFRVESCWLKCFEKGEYYVNNDDIMILGGRVSFWKVVKCLYYNCDGSFIGKVYVF